MLKLISESGGIMPLIQKAISNKDSNLALELSMTLRDNGYTYDEVYALFRDCFAENGDILDRADYEELIGGAE